MGSGVICRGHQVHTCPRQMTPDPIYSERQRVEQPADQNAPAHQAAEHAKAESKLLGGFVAHQHGKDNRDEEGEHDHGCQVTHLRPSATSNASSTTSMLSRPATIRKALPYSNDWAITRPAPRPAALAAT